MVATSIQAPKEYRSRDLSAVIIEIGGRTNDTNRF